MKRGSAIKRLVKKVRLALREPGDHSLSIELLKIGHPINFDRALELAQRPPRKKSP